MELVRAGIGVMSGGIYAFCFWVSGDFGLKMG